MERRADGHVSGATTTTAGVRRRPGAAGTVPAPRPGFPAACGRGLRARSHDGRADFARTAGCPKTLSCFSWEERTGLLAGSWRRGESWFFKLGALSPLSILLSFPAEKMGSGAGTRPVGNLGNMQMQRKLWQKGAIC